MRRAIRVAVSAVAVALVAAACGGTTSPTTGGASAGLSGTLNGAGATFPAPVYLEWIGAFQKENPGVKINYQGIGSGGGVQNFIQQTVDFAGSDAYLTDAELAKASANGKVFHMPTVMGAVVPAFNVSGVDKLTLDCDSLAGIFLGDITKWNDPALAALNPGVSLPDAPIQVVHRSDGSGTTNTFTLYLDTCNSTWHEKVGFGKDVSWPVGVGGKGNDGVAAAISQADGSIGYVELAYAIQSGLKAASMRNKSGNVVEPTIDSTSAAAAGVDFPADLRFTLADTSAPQGWPIATATWILGYQNMPADKAVLLKAFLTWSLTKGDDIARKLDYAPIPDSLQAKSLAFADQLGNG